MKFSMMRSLLRGNLLRSFNSRAAEVEIETDNAFQTSLQDLSLQLFPKHQPLQIQKRYMRQNIFKPRTMRIRSFIDQMIHLNDSLEQFPPDFGREQVLPEDELAECILKAMPPKRQCFLLTNGFDTLDDDLDKLTEILELQEAAKDAFGKGNQNNNAVEANYSQKRGNSDGTKWGRNLVVKDNQGNKKNLKSTNPSEKKGK